MAFSGDICLSPLMHVRKGLSFSLGRKSYSYWYKKAWKHIYIWVTDNPDMTSAVKMASKLIINKYTNKLVEIAPRKKWLHLV